MADIYKEERDCEACVWSSHAALVKIHAMMECIAEVSPEYEEDETMTVRYVRDLCTRYNRLTPALPGPLMGDAQGEPKMSYSLEQKCGTCTKEDRCTDRHHMHGAIQGIHNMPAGRDFGHMGYGTVELKCHAYDNRNKSNG